MRAWTFALAFTSLLAIPSVGHASDIDDCNSDQTETIIKGCSQIIDAGNAGKDALAVAFFNRGNAYGDSGDNDRSIADYTAAIKLKPDYVDSYFNRGLSYREKKDFDSAIADFNRVLKINPDYAKAYYARAGAYEGKGDLKQALADYKDALRLAPGNQAVLKKISEVAQKLEQ